MPKHGKKYRKTIEGIALEERVSAENALTQVVQSSYAKFDETVDVAINLGVNPRHSDQMVRGAVTLPHGLGKKVRVLVFCKGEKELEAKEAGADYAGNDELVEKISGGWLDFDRVVATPDMMAAVGKVGKILGPRGLMPNAKVGTVTNDVHQAVKDLKSGRIEFKVDKAGIVHAPIGKVSFGADKLFGNLKSLLEVVYKLKPSSAKGTYLKKLALSSTMGRGVKVDTTTLRGLID